MTSINLKIRNFNDNPYTIIPLPVCDELCSTSVYGSDQADQSRTSMARLGRAQLYVLSLFAFEPLGSSK